MLLEVFKFMKELFKNNSKSALIGLLLTPLFFYGIGAIFGVSIKDHLTYLVNKNYEAERMRILCQLEKFNDEIDKYEIESHEKQKQLWLILDKGLTGESHAQALGIANRNQDVIRALLEFGKIYTALVNANAHSEETHKHLSDMYESILYIITHDKKSFKKAFDLLKNVNSQIDDFPEVVREDVQIEVLRYLSYCAAQLDKKPDQETFNRQALKLKEGKEIDAKNYRRKFYWVDLSQLIALINNAEFEKAELVFRELRDNLADADFLKTKLLQHEALVKEQFRDEWNEYINSL